MTWVGVGVGVGGIAQGVSAKGAANATGNAMQKQAELGLKGTEEQIAEQKAEENARQAAYQTSRATGLGDVAAGENALTTEANTPNAMLTKEEEDIAAGNARELQQGAGQMDANLAAQGVRGGAAATLMNRGTGQQAISTQEDINKMKYEDEATRQADLRAYQAAKAGRGQSLASFGNF